MADLTPYVRGVAITKSDTVDIAGAFGRELTDSIYCGGAGVAVVVFEDGTTASYTVAVGTVLEVAARRVNSTNTTATLLIAQYRG